MKKIMLDTSIYSELALPENYKYIEMLNKLILNQKIQNLITHVQIDEIEKIVDQGKRLRVNTISRTFIPTACCIISPSKDNCYSKLGMCELGDGSKDLKMREVVENSKKRIRDSMISVTAVKYADMFFTRDNSKKKSSNQSKRFERNKKGMVAYNFEDLVKFLEEEYEKIKK